jgi:hypothetical protein
VREVTLDVTGPVVLVALLAVLLTSAVVVIWRMPTAERRARLGVLRARAALHRSRQRHAALVRQAQRALARVERKHSSTVATLDRRLVELEDPRGRRLDGFGPITLHELRIVTPAGEVPLDGVTVTFDTAGNLSETKRTTLTRLAVGGLVLGPLGAILALGFPKRRTVDNRELYLLVEAGAASCVVQVRPDDGGRVRAFAVQVNAAASAVETRRRSIAAELERTRQRLEAVHEDHTALDAARERLRRARVDPAAVAAVTAAETTFAAARETLADVRG